MTIVVSGASGFLGSCILRRFIKKKINVVGIYNKKKPKLKSKFLKLLKINLTKKSTDINGSILIHCASRTHVNSLENRKMLSDNNKMIENLLKNISNFKMIFFMSSVSVYGKINKNKLDEKTKIFNPGLYGQSKLENEKIFKKISREFKIPVFVFRLPGVVGENSHSNLLSRLIENIKNNNKYIKIYNSENKFNNLIHEEDIFKFIFHLIKKNKSRKFNIFNLSNNRPIKMKNVLNILINQSKKNIKIKIDKNNKKSFIISNKKAKSKGFKPYSVKYVLNRFFLEKN